MLPLVQQPPHGKAECSADGGRGDESQQVVRQSMLRRPRAAGECPRIALDVRLAVHEGEDLAVCHQVVLALDALEDGCDNKRRYRRQERRSCGDAGAPRCPPSS